MYIELNKVSSTLFISFLVDLSSALTNGCSVNPCQNYGTCVPIDEYLVAGFKCLCPEKYFGKYCELRVYEPKNQYEVTSSQRYNPMRSLFLFLMIMSFIFVYCFCRNRERDPYPNISPNLQDGGEIPNASQRPFHPVMPVSPSQNLAQNNQTMDDIYKADNPPPYESVVRNSS